MEANLKTPYADLVPPLSSDEFAALEADIKANGVRDPIIVDEAGNILDGHHRYRICRDAPRRVIRGLTEPEKQAFVIRANVARRNLSPEQKRGLQKKQREIARQLKAEKRWTQEEIARLLGVDQRTVGRWLDAINQSVEQRTTTNRQSPNGCTPLDCRVKIPAKLHPVIVDRVEAGEPQSQVAADFKVAQQTVSKIVAKERRRREVTALEAAPPPSLPTATYEVILADPPWQYEFSETAARRIENHYPTMSLEEIKAIQPPAGPNATLFLWATAPKLSEALQVMEAWGFHYRTHAVWDKQKIGMGYWFRSRHELLLVGVKGEVQRPPAEARPPSVFSSPRGAHSEKPEIVYAMIEAMFPRAKKLEMFARKRRDGWDAWGKGSMTDVVVHDFPGKLESSVNLSGEEEWISFYRTVWPGMPSDDSL